MNIIKVVFEREQVLIDENNQIITYDMLPIVAREACFRGMNGYHMDYYQEIYDSYFFPQDSESMDMVHGACFEENPHLLYLQHCLVTANFLKACLPDTIILFKNTNAYYDFKVDSNGFSEMPKDFDISKVILFKDKKKLKIMFDYEATGVWDCQDKCIDVNWVPVSQTTRNLITQFQHGLNSMRVNYDNDYTWDEERDYARYMVIGLKAAIEMKKELPDWQILIYNYACYFDLPLNPYNNCSEITTELTMENVIIPFFKVLD